MGFGKNLRSKMEKVFSSPNKDPEVINDPPPPYVLPPEFIDAGIKEDELEILRDYDTVIILDDSASMEPLWDQVSDGFSPLRLNSSLTLVAFCRRHVEHCRHSPLSPPDLTRTGLKSVSSITTSRGTIRLR